MNIYRNITTCKKYKKYILKMFNAITLFIIEDDY